MPAGWRPPRCLDCSLMGRRPAGRTPACDGETGHAMSCHVQGMCASRWCEGRTDGQRRRPGQPSPPCGRTVRAGFGLPERRHPACAFPPRHQPAGQRGCSSPSGTAASRLRLPASTPAGGAEGLLVAVGNGGIPLAPSRLDTSRRGRGAARRRRERRHPACASPPRHQPAGQRGCSSPSGTAASRFAPPRLDTGAPRMVRRRALGPERRRHVRLGGGSKYSIGSAFSTAGRFRNTAWSEVNRTDLEPGAGVL